MKYLQYNGYGLEITQGKNGWWTISGGAEATWWLNNNQFQELIRDLSTIATVISTTTNVRWVDVDGE